MGFYFIHGIPMRVVVGVLYKMLELAEGVCAWAKMWPADHISIPRSRLPSDVRVGVTYGL
jgi:hypothetical protein